MRLGLGLGGGLWRPAAPPFIPASVYQGNGAAFVSYGGVYQDFTIVDVAVEFFLYIAAHDQTVRGLLGSCDDFQGSAAGITWQVRLHSDDQLRFSASDGSVLTHCYPASPVPVGQWVKVGAYYNLGAVGIRLEVDDVSGNAVAADMVAHENFGATFYALGGPTRSFANGVQISQAKAWGNGFRTLDADMDEGGGVTSVNSAGADGVISDAAIHAPPLDVASWPTP